MVVVVVDFAAATPAVARSAAATAVAGTIALHAPLLLPALLPLVALVAASRVLLRVHHISDVVAGAGLGLAGALVATVLVNP